MGYVSVLKRYQAQNCEGCPLKSQCHKSKTNRIIEVNYNLNRSLSRPYQLSGLKFLS